MTGNTAGTAGTVGTVGAGGAAAGLPFTGMPGNIVLVLMIAMLLITLGVTALRFGKLARAEATADDGVFLH